MRYAQINEDNIVTGLSYLSGPVDAPGLIALSDGQEPELGSVYENGVFIPPEAPEIEPQAHQPSNADIAQMLADFEVNLIIAGVL